ncbi:hypothetical protein IFJ75_13375 [Brevundimonas goettingensis]|uniref:Uncharacterized protein n=1 Tax=Brevundimonas goettingensis TaxID=2774190 RepID=A0A975GV83_9CAUL|nr:hypothetical protein [Brevundimonas goettingensis]QTC90264.1 hypothetical protein IFJ75_13375 [Brevundimonas goettingensis]
MAGIKRSGNQVQAEEDQAGVVTDSQCRFLTRPELFRSIAQGFTQKGHGLNLRFPERSDLDLDRGIVPDAAFRLK